MNLPAVDLGDLPTWIQGGGALGQIALAVWTDRQRRAAEFARQLQSETGLDAEQVARAITEQNDLGPLVFEALDWATRTASEEKRWLLAKILAAAFRQPDEARIDNVGMMLRTVEALEGPDVRVLADFARPRPQNFPAVQIVGAVRSADLESALHDGQAPLVAPIVARLSREGLISDVAVGTYDYEPSWRLTTYGHEFVRFLPGTSVDYLSTACLVAVWGRGAKGASIVRNLGPGGGSLTGVSVVLGETPTSIQHAMVVSVVEDGGTLVVGENLYCVPSLPIRLDPGTAVEINFTGHGAAVLSAAARIYLTWTDEAGNQQSQSYPAVVPS